MKKELYWLVAGVAAIACVVVGVPAAVMIKTKHVSMELVGGVVLIGWLGALVIYFAWAIRRYNINHGFSDHEWAVLYPELYAPPEELTRYQKLHEQYVKQCQAEGMERPVLSEHHDNPYAGGMFGLPSGVIRGAMALTALVMFVVMEAINIFRPFDEDPRIEQRFGQLINAFLMVMAFYFGSRGVEVLQARRGAKPEEKEAAPVTRAPAPPVGSSGGQVAPAGQEPSRLQLVPAVPATPEALSERPAMPAHLQELRLASLAAPAPSSRPWKEGELANRALPARVLALTSSFETGMGFPACFGAVAGDFDRMGLSFGALQWNLGTGSLQPLWRQMREAHGRALRKLLGSPYSDEFERMLDASRAEQIQWARQIQRTVKDGSRTRWRLIEPWQRLLAQLGACDEMIAIQVEAARNRYEIAFEACQEWGLDTQRGVALMFDIYVQNGKVDKGGAGAAIRADYAQIQAGLPDKDLQLARMQIIAQRRSEVAAPQWRNDVLARKMTIANGVGMVHGRPYDLERQFGITLARVPELAITTVHPEVA